MAKKLYYNDVKRYIESFDYTLLSDTYENNRMKLKVRCDKGHEYEVTFCNFKNQNRRCPVCAGNKKLDYKYVKQYIENKGYVLLSNAYKNAITKLKLRCDKGHEYEVTFNCFQQGKRCPVCTGNIKLSYNDVKQYIEKHDYKLLSNEYKNSKEKLKLRCPEGHEYKVAFSDFKQGKRCPVCAGNIKLSHNDVKQYIESFDYSLLSDTYENNHTKLKVRCPEGHEYSIQFNNFKSGQRCPICSKLNRRLFYNDVKQYIESFDYTLLSDTYENNHTKLKVRCPEGHEYKVTFSSFKNKERRCPTCNAQKTSSKAEVEIANLVRNMLKDSNINVINNDRTQIINPLTGHNLELDIFIPDLNKAIEYNGSYWHSKEKVIIRDKMKMIQCKGKGIELMIIEEKEWVNNKIKVINKINDFINDVDCIF